LQSLLRRPSCYDTNLAARKSGRDDDKNPTRIRFAELYDALLTIAELGTLIYGAIQDDLFSFFWLNVTAG
jgi:hypothetical protein